MDDLQGVKAHLQVVDERLATMQADVQAIQTHIQSMQAEFCVLRAGVEPLEAKHRGETWEGCVLQSVSRYFREPLTARYATEGKVNIEILRTDRDARRAQREFTQLRCSGMEVSTRADDQDVARVLSRAEWLRNGITPPAAKPCCVVPCITALDWIREGKTGMPALQAAEAMGVACLIGQYVVERGQTLPLIPASSFAEWVAWYGQDAFRPCAPSPALEPGHGRQRVTDPGAYATGPEP